MIVTSQLLGFRLKVLSISPSVPLFTTSTMIDSTLASLEVTEPTKRFWQSRLQHQVLSTFTDDTEFTIHLPTGRIANNYYAHIGLDAN